MKRQFGIYWKKFLKGLSSSPLFMYKSLSVFLGSVVWAVGMLIKIKYKQSYHVDVQSLPWWYFHFCVMVFIVGFVPWFIWAFFYDVGYN